jgi:nanoRNase/pAp phosphatase (c-di-AMP/oligoRNAs hydrolase)
MSIVSSENVGKRATGRPKSTQERLRAFLKLFGHDETVLILIYPDPDSMASALAVKRLLWKRVRSTSIAYVGKIQRLENQAMMDLLKIPMVDLSKLDPISFSRRILVDAQPDHSETFEGYKYDAIIDHHPKTKKWDAPYVDIRPEYGATATILTEYLRSARIKPSMKLGTAIYYAIKTDTANFERAGIQEDVKQFRYVFQYANMNLLRKIEKSELTLTDLRYFQIALSNRSLSKKGLFTHMGKVPNADICVQVADFFTRVHGVGWSFVSCVSEGELNVVIRNDGYRKDAGKLAKSAFGHLGSAGGHRGAARARIPLEILREEGVRGDTASMARFVKERLKF